MTAEIINLKDRQPKTHSRNDILTDAERLEEAKRNMEATLQNMIGSCAKAIAVCDSDIINSAKNILGMMLRTIRDTSVISPTAPNTYIEIAELIEQLGDVVSAELKAQARVRLS